MNRASFSDRLTQVETNNAALKLEVQELRTLINSRKDSPDIEHGKGKRFKAEATILTKDEVVERLQKEQEEKARHISEMEKKRAALATKKEEEEKAKGLRMQQAYHTKWESLATRSEKLQSTLIDSEKAHQKNVQSFFSQMGALGAMGQFPQVRAPHTNNTNKQTTQTNKQLQPLLNDHLLDELVMKYYLPLDMHLAFGAMNTTGDGNCLFYAMSTSMSGSPKMAHELRLRAAHFMMTHQKSMKEVFASSVEFDLVDEVKRTLTPRVWGGPPQLFALAQVTKRRIVVLHAHLSEALAGKCPISTCPKKCRGMHMIYDPLETPDAAQPISLLMFVPVLKPNDQPKTPEEKVEHIHFVPPEASQDG